MMNLKNKYPELFQLFAGYFPDADLDHLTDQEVVANYKSDCSAMEITKTKQELEKLIADIGIYWQEIGEESNRYFKNEEDALIWLKMLQSILNQ